MGITHDQAQHALTAALDYAATANSPSSVAIVDAGRDLIAFARQDGALLSSTDLAIGKAYTARSVNMKTGDLGPYVQPGGIFYGIERSQRGGPFITFGGGEPIIINGVVVGAIGVAGGALDDDIAAAAAGAAAVVSADADE